VCGSGAKDAARYRQQFQAQAPAKRRGVRDYHLVWGLLHLSLGLLLLSVFVWSVLSQTRDGELHFLWYGALLFGGAQAIRGVRRLFAIRRAVRASEAERPSRSEEASECSAWEA
jgi:hypothetical protein